MLPGVADKLRELNEQGYFVAIVSNQGGIPQHISLDNADAALTNLSQDLSRQAAFVHYFDFAENNDDDRKPGIGMALRLETKLAALGLKIDKENSFMVGDSAYRKATGSRPADTRPDGRPGFNFSNSDRYFADNYGIKFYEPQTYFGWEKYGVELIENRKDLERLEQAMKNAQAVNGAETNTSNCAAILR